MPGLVFIFLCLIWGSTWMAIKIGLSDAPPIWSAGIRIVLSAFILLAYNKIAGLAYPAGWKNKLRVIWVGALIYGASYIFVYIGTRRIDSSLAAIIFAAFPFFTALMVPIFVKTEQVTGRAILGMLVGFLGIVLVFNGPIALTAETLVGGSLIILSTLVSAYGLVHIKAYLHDEPILPMMGLQMTLGGAIIVVAALFFEDITTFRFTTATVGSILYLAIFGTLLTFGGYWWLLKKIGAIRISLIAFVTPIVAVFLGWIFLGEQLAFIDYVGAGLVLGGVLLVNLRQGSFAKMSEA